MNEQSWFSKVKVQDRLVSGMWTTGRELCRHVAEDVHLEALFRPRWHLLSDR
jgi:hypothetical protein